MDQLKIYIGDQFGKIILDGVEFWYMSAKKYVRFVVENVEQNLSKFNQHLPTRCKTPIMSGYQPKTYTSHKLKAGWVTQYQ